jgi:hypothetical protein
MAILHAIESKAVNGNGGFPAGSRIAAWGKVNNMPEDKDMTPCDLGSSTAPKYRYIRVED